jgi:hypothetical protein
MNDLKYNARQPKYSSAHTTMVHFSIGNTKNQYIKNKVILTAPSDFNFCSRLLEVW